MKKSIFLLLTAAFSVLSVQAATFYGVTDINKLVAGDEVVITMAYDGVTYALSSEGASGSAPKSEAVTLTDGALADPAAKYVFIVEQVAGGCRFVHESGDFLYLIDDNKGLRVGKPKAGTTYTDVFNVKAEAEYNGYLYG